MKKGIGFVSKVRVYKELSLLEEHIKHIKSKLDLDAYFDSAPILKHLHVSYDTLLIYEIQNTKTKSTGNTTLTPKNQTAIQFQHFSRDAEIYNLLFNQNAEDLKTVLLEIDHCNSKEEADLYLNSLYDLYKWHMHENVFKKFKNQIAGFFETP